VSPLRLLVPVNVIDNDAILPLYSVLGRTNRVMGMEARSLLLQKCSNSHLKSALDLDIERKTEEDQLNAKLQSLPHNFVPLCTFLFLQLFDTGFCTTSLQTTLARDVK
jgi:hypothetical protein